MPWWKIGCINACQALKYTNLCVSENIPPQVELKVQGHTEGSGSEVMLATGYSLQHRQVQDKMKVQWLKEMWDMTVQQLKLVLSCLKKPFLY